jgi:ubiquinone/menaquinone biosynthesis C-methylase UbiE
MTQQPIRFDDGAAYERMMGVWSRLVGQVFLDWLSPATGQRWLDVGCGNGAFTEMLIERCAPGDMQGIDPSAEQIAFARTRLPAQGVVLQQGDAMALPFDNSRFDMAVMALAIHFVPDPAKGVSEMARVVCPGGTVAAYTWDEPGRAGPLDPIEMELRAMGITPLARPSAHVQRLEVLQDLWTNAGLQDVETRAIMVTRSFSDFEDFWMSSTGTGAIRPLLKTMPAVAIAQLQARVRERLAADTQGRITYASRAFAVKGRVPRTH